jgi:cobalt-zinc-cadmium efflux system outer membrane protein
MFSLVSACVRRRLARLAATYVAGFVSFSFSTRSASAAPSLLAAQGSADPTRADFLATATLDCAAFVRAVLLSNPSIEGARQAWRAARARVRQAGVLEDPMLDVGVAPLSIPSSRASFGFEAGISQKLPWFGKRSLEVEAAAAEAGAAEQDYEGLRRELAFTALTLYDQYFVVARSIEINAAHVALMRELRDSAIAQFSSGHASAQDSLQAEAELTHMEHDTVVLASERDVLVAQMNELLHRAPELPLPPPPAELALPARPEAEPGRLARDALTSRPDLAAARARVRQQGARALRAEREDFPDFTLSTSYSSMWDMPEHRWMVGVGLQLPLQLDKRAAAVEEARAHQAQVESELERMSTAARTQVFAGAKRIEESAHLMELFETRLLPIARSQIDAARAGFIALQNPFMAVVEAERNLRKVELEYQMARADYAQRLGELERALGRIPGLEQKGSEP